MSEQEFKKLFAKNLDFYLSKNGMTNLDLAEKLGVSESAVASWRRGDKSARMKYVDQMCEIFGIRRTDMMSDDKHERYIDPETAQIAEKIYSSKELRLLFNAAKDASSDDLKTTYDMLKALKDKEVGNDN
ncbi:MAG: helix-turn-helix domain-containing protein [Lentisphaeria bacterium]